MKTQIINENNLTVDDIAATITRVKCFIENSEGDIILGCTKDGCMQLPGGHVEEGEELKIAAIREVEEETGIVLDENDYVEPFYQIDNYVKNYRGSGKNKLARMIYFHVKTDKKINLNNINLTEDEKTLGLTTGFIALDEIENKLQKNIAENNIEIYRVIAKETLSALREFKNIKIDN